MKATHKKTNKGAVLECLSMRKYGIDKRLLEEAGKTHLALTDNQAQ
jgi:hypothetical protein